MTQSNAGPDKEQVSAVRAALRKLREPRHDNEPTTRWLQSLVKKFKNPASALAWLAAYDLDPRVQEDAVIMIFTAMEEPSVPAQVKQGFHRAVPPVLMQALKDESLPDARKATLAPVLFLCGVEVPRDELASFFNDFEGATHHLMRETAEKLPDNIESVAQELDLAGLINDDGEEVSARQVEEAFALGESLSEMNAPVAAGLLAVTAATARQFDICGADASHALDLLVKTGERGAWFLGEIGRLPAMGELGEKARALRMEMMQSGIAAHPPGAGEFTHGLVSTIDGIGARSLMLFYRTEEGELDALSILLSDETGIKDAWCVCGNAAGMDDELREENRESGHTYAPCNIDFARRAVSDALAIHEERGQPVPGMFLLCRHLLGNEPLEVRRCEPNLGVYMLETVSPRADIVERSDELIDTEIFGGLWCCSDEAYNFVSRVMPKKRRRTKNAIPYAEAIIMEFISIVARKSRQKLASRMAINLEVEAMAGRAKESANRMAALTWLALSQEIVAYEKIPFIQSLGCKAMIMIEANLRNGHRNQDEANQAGWEKENKILETMSTILDDTDLLEEEEW